MAGEPGSRPPRAFVIGHPIAHSRSPIIHGHWLKSFGLAGSYERIDVPPESLAAFVSRLAEGAFRGGNVTIPHKEAVMGHLAAVTPEARRIGAVNTLAVEPDGRVRGHNTDGEGFAASLDGALGPDWERATRTVLVLGAGGAARAVVDALLRRGVARIVVLNRTRSRADEICAFDRERVVALPWDSGPELSREADLLVNTTSLGMTGQPELSFGVDLLPPGAAVADIVYVPLETGLLASARARGLRVVGGLGMLLHQAVPGFELWFGRRPAVTPELVALLEADLRRAS